jgi:hypothetical protein
MEQPDGRVMQIYCHWDGYLDHNGKILQEHYRDRAKVLALMLLGDLSSLREDIGEAHDDEINEKWCTACGRDRGETDTVAHVFRDFEDYREHHQYEEFEYVFRRDDQWYVAQYERGYEPLAKVLAGLAVAEDQ